MLRRALLDIETLRHWNICGVFVCVRRERKSSSVAVKNTVFGKRQTHSHETRLPYRAAKTLRNPEVHSLDRIVLADRMTLVSLYSVLMKYASSKYCTVQVVCYVTVLPLTSPVTLPTPSPS
jgi:hypothetical protein